MANAVPLKLASGKLKQFGATDTIPTGNLGTGSASANTVLFGDQSYKEMPIGMLVTAAANGYSFAAGLTHYSQFFFGNSTNATQAARQNALRYDCTVKDFYVRTRTAQPGTGSLVLTMQKNGTDTAITITIAAGSAIGTFTDASNTVSFAKGDLVGVKYVNNASGTSAEVYEVSAAMYI